jgi:predicted ferric reductase
VTNVVRGLLWSVVYLAAVIAPLFFMLVGDAPPGRGWWMELSIALGFIGLAMVGLQFAVTARFHPVDAPYGLDAVLQYHRQISLVAFGFILLHPAILMVEDPERLALLNPATATTAARWGLASVVLLIAIVVTSVWRAQLKLNYEVWRILHGLLAIGIVITALVHVERVGYYVSGPWRRGLWIVMSLVLVGLLGYVRLYKPWRLLRTPYVIDGVEQLPGDTWRVHLRPDGHEGLRFSPGQFAWLTVGNSPFQIEEHPFSFSSSAERPQRLSFTIKELGDFTSRIGELEPGTRAYLDGPYGAFSYERNQGSGFVFLAGGIGISPIMSQLRTLADREDPRAMLLFYANPDLDDVALREELDRLEVRLDLEVVSVLEDPPDDWDGEAGLIGPELLDRYLPAHEELLQFFVCGPDPMMDAVEEALLDRGIPPGHVNLERFDFI